MDEETGFGQLGLDRVDVDGLQELCLEQFADPGGAVESDADSLEKIIDEVASTRVTERGSRIDDKRSEAAMEDRKKEGYF